MKSIRCCVNARRANTKVHVAWRYDKPIYIIFIRRLLAFPNTNTKLDFFQTEFLIQLDGAATPDQDRILIVGATNRPQELDEAARRRLVKRLYIPLPEQSARIQILKNLLRTERTDITIEEIERVGTTTEGFSGADMQTLCHEAAMGPIRTITETQMNHVDVADVRPVNYADFQSALDCVRASVSQNDLKHYIEWDCTYGSGAGKTKWPNKYIKMGVCVCVCYLP